MKASKNSFVETIGVILGLAGLTCVVVGAVAFLIDGEWKNSFSITFLPVGVIFLVGSAFIMWRLTCALALPAGIVVCAVGAIAWSDVQEGASTLQYTLPTIIGAVLVVGSIVLNVILLVKGGRTRKGLVGANVVVMCLIGLVLLCIVNYMAALYYNKRDLTKSGKFTLADKTVQVLKNLDEPVKVTVVMQPAGPHYDFAKNMLDDYARFSDGKLSVDYIDPTVDSDAALKFFEELKGGDKIQSIVFQTSGTFKQVPSGDLIERGDPWARMRGIPQEPKFKGESEFTAALIKVTDKDKSVIYFTTGKGEVLLEPAGRQPAMAVIAGYIKDDNYDVRTINIAIEKSIPDDCTILAIIGPKRAFSTLELDQISDYLNVRHGKLLVALEPTGNEVMSSGLENILEEWGIRARPDVTAIDVRQTLLGGLQGSFDVYASHPMHPITEKMQGFATLFSWSCVVETVQPPPGPPGQQPPSRYDVAALATTTKQGWGEVDGITRVTKYDAGRDIAGPVLVAACSQERDTSMPPRSPYGPPPKPNRNFNGARIVVLGDSDAFTDSSARRGPGNIDFALNCINWLAKKTVRLGISAKLIYAEPIRIKSEEVQAIFYSTLFGLPYLALVIGGIVYWRRSR